MIYHIFANRSNIGDWLSARGIQSLLAPMQITELLCDTPFVDETMQRLAKASPDDVIIIGGGGLFMDYFAPFWKSFLEIADRVPYCIWGAGACDLKQEHTRMPAALLKAAVEKSRLCVVRDELTYRMIGGPSSGSSKVPPPVPCPSIAAVRPAPPPGQPGGFLHVNNYTTVGAPAYKTMRRSGMAFARKTGRPFHEINNRIPAGNAAALEKMLALYGASDRVAASALHGCILALALGRKTLAVSGDRKIESFMQAAGLGDWVLDANELRPFRERLDRLHEQPDRAEFFERARAQNARVAETVKALAGAASLCG